MCGEGLELPAEVTVRLELLDGVICPGPVVEAAIASTKTAIESGFFCGMRQYSDIKRWMPFRASISRRSTVTSAPKRPTGTWRRADSLPSRTIWRATNSRLVVKRSSKMVQ